VNEGVSDPLGIAADAAARAGDAIALARQYMDPSLAEMLRVIGFDKQFGRAEGTYLYDIDGNAYLDFHAAEGFITLGHNHPDVLASMQAVLAAELAHGVQIHYSPLAGLLAEEFARLLPDGLDATFFASTGAEAVDSAMKFARAATGRTRLLSCEGGYHGVTYGPLSLVGEEFFKPGFGPFLPDTGRVPFGDLDALERELKTRKVAAFIVEPIQGIAVTLPPPGYLLAAQELCHRYGTLFVADEIQTGLGRTGRWFALEEHGLDPDFVLISKALSGGFMPVAAMVTRREIYQKAVGTLERSYVHQSTYGRNRLSMAAGLATIRVIERDGLLENAARMGKLLEEGLLELQRRHELLKEVRIRGLMVGLELGAPKGRAARLSWRLIHLASEGLFPQLIVIPLHRDHRIITMASGMNDVIKLLPPMTTNETEVGYFLDALDTVLKDSGGVGSRNWAVVRDIATATLTRRNEGSGEARGGESGVGAGGAGAAGAGAVAAGAAIGTPIDPSQDNVCLVTGGTGFIGGHLVKRLVADGYQVRCLVRPTSDTSALEKLPVELVRGDLTDARSLRAAASGCKYVLHSAAMVSDWGTIAEIEAANVGGTRNVVAAAVDAGVDRFIQISSTDVYGYPGGRGVDEAYTATRFRNWYAQTKLAAEAEVRRAETADGLEAVILRPATVYGPGSKETVGEIAKALRGGQMLMIGGGRADAGLCYIENLADAAMLALTSDAAPGTAFNVCDGDGITWRRFTDDLAAGIGSRPARWNIPYPVAYGLGVGLEQGYRAVRRATGLQMRALLSRQAVQILALPQSFSNRQARELLGWAPGVDYAAGLAATLDWLRTDYL
jgi:ornithine--oxo-acid transaminase